VEPFKVRRRSEVLMAGSDLTDDLDRSLKDSGSLGDRIAT
jgi:hypothetical protein